MQQEAKLPSGVQLRLKVLYCGVIETRSLNENEPLVDLVTISTDVMEDDKSVETSFEGVI
jgi:hypothetical protein